MSKICLVWYVFARGLGNKVVLVLDVALHDRVLRDFTLKLAEGGNEWMALCYISVRKEGNS